MGLEYQRVAYQSINEKASVAKMLKKKEQMIERYKVGILDDSILFYNNDFQDYWYQVMTNYNEVDAFDLLKNEATRLKTMPDYKEARSIP